jgi:hypothetical protein
MIEKCLTVDLIKFRYRLTQLFLGVEAILTTKLEVRAFKTKDKIVW